jgi:succinate dehydrogenase / fumarate reductase membrane anchor subunit
MSAKHATAHFVAERLTSIALLVLLPWLIFSAAASVDGAYESARAWLSNPINAILAAVVLAISFYHMRLGMQVIIEDYIAKPGMRGFLLSLNTLACLAAALVAFFSLYRISFGG